MEPNRRCFRTEEEKLALYLRYRELREKTDLGRRAIAQRLSIELTYLDKLCAKFKDKR